MLNMVPSPVTTTPRDAAPALIIGLNMSPVHKMKLELHCLGLALEISQADLPKHGRVPLPSGPAPRFRELAA